MRAVLDLMAPPPLATSQTLTQKQDGSTQIRIFSVHFCPVGGSENVAAIFVSVRPVSHNVSTCVTYRRSR